MYDMIIPIPHVGTFRLMELTSRDLAVCARIQIQTHGILAKCSANTVPLPTSLGFSSRTEGQLHFPTLPSYSSKEREAYLTSSLSFLASETLGVTLQSLKFIKDCSLSYLSWTVEYHAVNKLDRCPWSKVEHLFFLKKGII